mgnify:CR=1 FL=1
MNLGVLCLFFIFLILLWEYTSRNKKYLEKNGEKLDEYNVVNDTKILVLIGLAFAGVVAPNYEAWRPSSLISDY